MFINIILEMRDLRLPAVRTNWGISFQQLSRSFHTVEDWNSLPWTQETVDPSLILGQISLTITEPSGANYTGRIPQRLDTNVHSAVAAKMSTAL